jgi:hypothetical protein
MTIVTEKRGRGRPRLTPEARLAKLDKQVQRKLISLRTQRQAMADKQHAIEVELGKEVTAAIAAGASYRDIAALLELPHQTLYQLVQRTTE